ncbi:MAG: hypothetical protein U0264_04270 [Candidatus Kapaibacterium sp.]
MLQGMTVIMLFCAGIILHAQPTVKKVSVFKNGSALVVREGTADIKDGTFILPVPENIVYGTLSVTVGKDAGLRGIIARTDTIKNSVPCDRIRDYLRANIGNYVTLKIQYNGEKPYEKIFSGIIDYINNDNMIRIKTDAGATAMFSSNFVDYVEVRGNASNTNSTDSIVKRLHVMTNRQSGSTDVQASYMTRGITWVPTYSVKMQSDTSAQLELRATIENNIEDLTNSDVELIIGAPEMSYLDKADPLFYSTGSFSNGLQNLSVSNNGSASNSFGTFAAAANTIGNAGGSNTIIGTTRSIIASEMPDISAESNVGEKSGDIYAYSLKDVTLKKSGRGMFTLTSRAIKAVDRYEATLKTTLRDILGSLTYRPDAWNKNVDVFHSLELWNSGSSPLTAGAMTVSDKDGRIIGQNTVYYTPAGAKTYLRLSKAIDITINSSEEEASREENAKKIKKVVYTKSRMRGTLTITNYQTKSAAVSVNRELAGNVLSASDNGKKSKTIVPNDLNAASKIEWQITVGAGETKTLEYEYDIFTTF